MKRRFPSLIGLVLLLSLSAGLTGGAAAQSPQPPGAPSTANQALIAQLQQEAGAPPLISYHALTGKVRFLNAVAHPIPRPSALTASAAPEQAARAFLATYGSLFGLADEANELRSERTQAADGRSFVRFQQLHAGVPVLGGELNVQLDSQRNVLSANGELLPAPEVDVKPTVDPSQAQQQALDHVARQYGVNLDTLIATTPELWIYSPLLLGARGPFVTSLTWRLEVTSDALPIRELVLVDAQRAIILLRFNQVDSTSTKL